MFSSTLVVRTVLAAGLIAASSVAKAADEPAPAPAKAKPKPAADAPFFFVNDNRLTYAYKFNGADPGLFTRRPDGTYDGKTSMQVFGYTHFDAWAYGTNFIQINLTKSGHNDPASPCTNAGVIQTSTGTVAADCSGATDIYGQIRSTFGLNEIFDTKVFTVGPLRNVSLEVGADYDSQNTYLGPAKRAFSAGLQFAVDLPYKGYINFAPLYYMQSGHNGFSQCGNFFADPVVCNSDGTAHFQDTWAFEVNYYMDLGFLPESVRYFSISGRAGWYGPKGHAQGLTTKPFTVTELNSEPIRLTFDAGRAVWGQKYAHQVDFWVAYRYWQNMSGYDHNATPFLCTVSGVSTNSCTESTAVTGVTVKF